MIQTIRWDNYNRSGELASPFLRGSKERPLRITLHSPSLKKLTGEEAEAIELIREFGKLNELKVVETEPTNNSYIDIGNIDATQDFIPVQLINYGQVDRYTSISDPQRLSLMAKNLTRQSDITHPDVEAALEAIIIALAHCQVGGDILVTSSKHLLDHRKDSLLIQSNPRTPLEASQIMGLFLRSRGNFVFRMFGDIPAPFSRHLFYWVLARHLLPGMWRYFSACVHANNGTGDDLLMLGQGILERSVRALQARDAIGEIFYGGSGEQEEVMYHFDYLPLLLAGAIDAQARVAHRVYAVDGNERTASFYELKKNGKKYRDRLKEKGATKLSDFLSEENTQRLLTILYETRNVIHAAPMHPISYQDGSSRMATLATVPIAISDCLLQSVQKLGDTQGWGFLENKSKDLQMVEPFSFSTTLVERILNIINTIAESTEVERLLPPGHRIDLTSAKPEAESPFEWGKRLSLLS